MCPLLRVKGLMVFVAVALPTVGLAVERGVSPSPKLLRPAAQAEISFPDPGRASIALAWEPVAGAMEYRFVVGSSADLAKLLVDRKTTQTWVELRGLGEGKYYWRVEAVSSKAKASVSTTASFSVKAAQPGLAK